MSNEAVIRSSVATPLSASHPPVHYTNYCRVSGAPGELFIDFGVMQQASPKASEAPIERRMAMSPFTAKRMLGALNAALKHYEQIFGCIDIDDHAHASKSKGDHGHSHEHAAPQPAQA